MEASTVSNTVRASPTRTGSETKYCAKTAQPHFGLVRIECRVMPRMSTATTVPTARQGCRAGTTR